MCGQPGQGIHATRLFGFAFWDIALTIIAAIVLKQFAWFKQVNVFIIILALVGLGIVVHKALGIKTKLNSMIFTA